MFDQNRKIEFEKCVKTMLEILGENPDREGLLNTPKRVAKAYEFITSGYWQDPKDVLNDAMFDSSNNEMVLLKDIEFYSICEHHLLPIIGRAHVAYIPDGKVVGLSKIPKNGKYICKTSANSRANDRANRSSSSRCNKSKRRWSSSRSKTYVHRDARSRKDKLYNDDIGFKRDIYKKCGN